MVGDWHEQVEMLWTLEYNARGHNAAVGSVYGNSAFLLEVSRSYYLGSVSGAPVF